MSVFIDNDPGVDVPDRYHVIAEDIVQAALEYIDCPYECEVNIVFTDNSGIREMNSSYRGIDAPTDVLSFPLISYRTAGDFSGLTGSDADMFNCDTGELMLGDIVLNVDRIKSQAEEYGHTRRRETAFLVAHSMLHLFGYDHIDDAERENMEKIQEQILNQKGYTRENEEE